MANHTSPVWEQVVGDRTHKEQVDLVYKLAWVVAIASVVGDLATTIIGLRAGLPEQNPFVRAFLVEYQLAGLVGLKVAALLIMLGICTLGRRYAIAGLAGLAIPQAIATVLNIITLLSM